MEALVNKLGERSYTEIVGIGLVAASVVYVCSKALPHPKQKGVYPPGPPKDPFIGNLRHFPKGNWWVAFNQWQKEYGDIVFLDIPSTPFIIINSLDVAQELLTKRASSTSGRKTGYMCKTLLGWDWKLSFRQADETHQALRKILRLGIGPQCVSSFDPTIENASNQWLLSIRDVNGDPLPSVYQIIGEVIISVAYGRQIWDAYGPELVKLNNESVNILNTTFVQFWLVDIFNWMRFIPSWMPGAEFRRRGIRSTKITARVREWPYAESVKLFNAGSLDRSVLSEVLEKTGPSDDLRDALANLYFAGVDTVGLHCNSLLSSCYHLQNTSVIALFFMAMLLFPEVARRVQEEITNVIGVDRLLKISDRENLPYTEAVWKEALRWSPAAPFGLPHVNITEEYINGYVIPKGSLIHANVGFMLNDPAIWGDPEVFRPERFLAPDASQLPNPLTLMFGFGLRVCPGMHLADRIGFHLAVNTLSVYSVLPMEGKERPEPSSMEYAPRVVRMPKNLECRFVPRNDKAQELLSSLSMASS